MMSAAGDRTKVPELISVPPAEQAELATQEMLASFSYDEGAFAFRPRQYSFELRRARNPEAEQYYAQSRRSLRRGGERACFTRRARTQP